MGFRIEGWDDIEIFLNEYRKGLDPQTFDDWARCVAETAKTMCDDPACKRIKPLQLRQQDLGKVNLNLEVDDNKVAIDCILKAIGQHQESMPYSLQQIYSEIKNQLEAKKAGF
jgi:hypothetical protein